VLSGEPLELYQPIRGYSAEKEPTPLWGFGKKFPEVCRCDAETRREDLDCGCGFGQCEKGLIS
jgi:hypothetical protein